MYQKSRWVLWACNLLAILAIVSAGNVASAQPSPKASERESASEDRRLLYVAVPGIRNYLEYGGHGLLVFDVDDGHRFVKRIPTAGLDSQGQPLNVKGICADAPTARLYISTLKSLIAIDLRSDAVLWEKEYEGGCDRMALSPDGTLMYLPSLEKDHWHVIDALSGDVLAKIIPRSAAHNTVYGPDGKRVYLAGLRSNELGVADTATHALVESVGPFSASIRPFTINGSQTLCFVNVNDLLGFEVGNLTTGEMLHRVEVEGFDKGPVKRHGCPSHGIAMTPDETELWLCDAANERIHLFDATVMPPKQLESIKLRDQPGWVSLSIDGRFAYPSTGDVIDTATREIVAHLTDETGAAVQSEKLLEIVVRDGRPIRAGNQFGIGQKASAAGH